MIWAAGALIIGIVVNVTDGDTLDLITSDRQAIFVRLAEIDAPELHQPYGESSRNSLAALCLGRAASVHPVALDRYRRIVGHVTCGGRNANVSQLMRGLAWVYPRYANNPDFYKIQSRSRGEARGLWRDPEPIPPWKWRRSHRRSS